MRPDIDAGLSYRLRGVYDQAGMETTIDNGARGAAPPWILRRARSYDAAGIGRVHALSERATYRGIVPDATLARRTPEERGEWWTRALAARADAADARWIDLVAEADGTIIGFSSTGPSGFSYGSTFAPFDLYFMYLLPEWERRRVGTALLDYTLAELKTRGVRSMQLLCVGGTPASSFYEAAGARLVETAHHNEDGAEIPHGIYVFDLA
jgi:GNAT superfamily N-acetyltransferase